MRRRSLLKIAAAAIAAPFAKMLPVRQEPIPVKASRVSQSPDGCYLLIPAVPTTATGGFGYVKVWVYGVQVAKEIR